MVEMTERTKRIIDAICPALVNFAQIVDRFDLLWNSFSVSFQHYHLVPFSDVSVMREYDGRIKEELTSRITTGRKGTGFIRETWQSMGVFHRHRLTWRVRGATTMQLIRRQLLFIGSNFTVKKDGDITTKARQGPGGSHIPQDRIMTCSLWAEVKIYW